MPCDLAVDWLAALRVTGFDPAARTLWLIEGLLQYLDAAIVECLFAGVDSLSAPGSAILYDVVGTGLLNAPQLGQPCGWCASSAPVVSSNAQALEPLGWATTLVDPGEPGTTWWRWPFR